MLEDQGVQVMGNEHRQLKGSWGALQLVFTDDYYTGRGDLAAAVEGVPEKGFRFAVTHSPQIFDSLNKHGIDYAICGHTHGGQVALPFIGAIATPGGGWFPELDKGEFRDGDATLYIDSGIGTTGPRLRLLNQSQVTVHVLGPRAGA